MRPISQGAHRQDDAPAAGRARADRGDGRRCHASGPPHLIAGAILAGGAASRFGGIAKGLQRVGGRRIIDRVAGALRDCTDRLIVVSNDPSAAQWIDDAEVARDVLPGRASLIGIHAALAHAETNIIVVAWDMPFVPAALLSELRRRLRAGVGAVIPIGPDGPEAACAAYSPLALPHIERLVRARDLKLSALVDRLPNVDIVSAQATKGFGDARMMFMNVNSPQELRRAEDIAVAL